MAIGWLTVLQSVPWKEVVSTAPLVADGARKLWRTIGGKPAEAVGGPAATAPEAHGLADLQARLAANEAATARLHEQMLASSELIKALAEQNTQLIMRIEAGRVRVLWLAGVAVVSAVLAVTSLTLVLTG